MSERSFNPSKAHRLDVPERQLWLPAAEVMGALNVRPGDTVADIGAGTGYFSVPLAMATDSEGRVYAVDAQDEMLVFPRQKLQNSAELNIDLVHAEADATGLPNACCNLIFLANVWHEFVDRKAVLCEVRRILSPGGHIAILDWRPDVEHNAGPPLDYRIRVVDAIEEPQTAGFLQITHANIGRYSWLVQARMPS